MPIETLRSLALAAGHADLPVPEARSGAIGIGMSIADLDAAMDAQAFGSQTYTGKTVSQTSALTVSTVWACIDAKAKDFAALPMMTFRQTAAGRELAQDHYLWRIWQYEANPELTAFRCKHLLQTWLDLWGNAYAELETNGRGQVIAIWPWRPDRVRMWRSDQGGLFYTYILDNGGKRTVPHYDMLHLRGMSLDGVTGLSPIEYHRQTVGLSLAMTEHNARFYGNGARPLGVLEHPEVMGEDAQKRFRDSWNEKHQGLSNAHRLAILEEGMKYHEVGMKMVDAQYLESQNFGVEELCRVYSVPPHRIGHLAKATNNNIEELGRQYVDNTISPLSANWEQEIEFSMLSPRDRGNVFVRVNFRRLMRGNMTSQAEFYTKLVSGMIMAPNEAREELEMNPMPLKKADGLWAQGAMVHVTDNAPEVPVATEVQQQTADTSAVTQGVNE
jgi:HK97 family phage portal protein